MPALPGAGAPVSGSIAGPAEPDMPADFAGELVAEWERVVADLRRNGVLDRDNGAAIEIYVRNLVRMREAERHVGEFGAIVPAPRTGVPMQNPYLAIANRAAETVAKMAAELGLTPSSRARVSKAPTSKKAARASDAYLRPGAAAGSGHRVV